MVDPSDARNGRSSRGWTCLPLSLSVGGVGLLWPAMASAQSGDGAFTAPSSGDWASAFIDFLFNGGEAAAGIFSNPQLAMVASALRHGMAIYSLAMLVLAGFLLFYHIASMVAETAHQGVAMGRRTNQLWAPIRLIVAIVLLVPALGGLSVGQYLVLGIASAGSNLASRAWNGMSESFGTRFLANVTPHLPDVSGFVSTAVDIELCHNVYDQMRVLPGAEAGARLAGVMGDMRKMSASGGAAETWRYTNVLNANAPMCGEYRFGGQKPRKTVNIGLLDASSRMAAEVAAFSRAQTESVVSQARSIAFYPSSAFSGSMQGAVPDVRGDLSSLRAAVQKQLEVRLQSLNATQASMTDKYMAQRSNAGWIAAGFFVPDVMRLQQGYGDLVENLLPSVQEPAFAHHDLTQQVLFEALGSEPALRVTDRETADSTARFYAKVSQVNQRIRGWLTDSQNDGASSTSISAFDLRDHVSLATDPTTAFSLLANAVDASAASYGVWGDANNGKDGGNPFSASLLQSSGNPLAGLIEFGRRQLDLGLHLVGLTSGLFSYAQLIAPSVLAGFLGVLFILGGATLIFFVPLLPFVRFIFAVLHWLLELFESLIAVPIVAVAHLTPSGEGLSGGAARQAYLLWIALAIRPVLTLFGLVVGVLVFALGLLVLQAAFIPLAQMAAADTGASLLPNAGMVLVYDVMAYAVANVAFQGVTRLPDQALRWISTFVMTDTPAPDVPVAVTADGAAPLALPASFTSLTQAVARYAGRDGAAGASASSPMSGRRSATLAAMFPVSQKEFKSTDVSLPGAAKPSATSPVPPPSSVAVNVTLPGKDKKKDKDKEKTPPEGETPFASTPGKKEPPVRD